MYSQSEQPLENVEFAAVAIKSVPSGRHVGVLHRNTDSGEVELLHLAWHRDLRNETPKSDYFWVQLAVPSLRLKQVAAVCRQVWRANGRAVPYGFSPPNDCFDENSGRFLLGPTRHGLTCASFVLSVFDRAGLQLARYESWQQGRQGDREWQKFVAEALVNHPEADEGHLAAVRNGVGSIRVRPEDVAACALCFPPTVEAEAATRRAEEVLSRISSE